MATIKTRYTLGDTIHFIDCDGKKRKEIIRMIETQLVEGYDLWVIYGYGDNLYELNHVSEHKILISQKQLNEQQQNPGKLSKATIT
ncbi:hypothetical protein NC796_10155 [Aliifodinibius sp. S!AR15-10]|uniref:hypothetical protein n=1 Tax=Aliifodinibius sp. S!AR15-10 TaxID=2950437 RepID=UPI0028554FD2|nr:hypothetical protein [Aliifodinibius sp. S!AR15-10]MDR8391503.1 hypothetical protein [Aliifodinibius sp. S!AR15-10]